MKKELIVLLRAYIYPFIYDFPELDAAAEAAPALTIAAGRERA